MMINMNNKKKYWRSVVCCFAAGILLLSCSDWNDMGTETIPDETNRIAEEGIGIAFSSSVAASHQDTRANTTIVKLGDTQLPTTANSTFYAGLFGCYTGPYTWEQLITLKRIEDPTDEQKQILKDYYTPNLLYNA